MSHESRALVVCVDLEPGSTELIRTAAKFGHPILVLCVVPEASKYDQNQVDRRIRALLGDSDQDLVAEVEVRRGDPEDQILTYAREHPGRALALGRRTRVTIDRIYVSSTTSEVAALAPCPVLVVPLDTENACEAVPMVDRPTTH
jgi:nucleotide-binding universal stress UspA family protein